MQHFSSADLLKNQRAWSSVLGELESTAAGYLACARKVAPLVEADHSAVRVACLSSFNCDFLKPYVVVENARRGVGAACFFGSYGQIDQQILDDGSDLYVFAPHVVFVQWRMEDVFPDISGKLLRVTGSELEGYIEGFSDRVLAWITAFRKKSSARLLISNFFPPPKDAMGLARAHVTQNGASFAEALNGRLKQIAQNHPDVFIFDVNQMVLKFGYKTLFDAKMYYMGRVPYGFQGQVAIAAEMARYVRAVHTTPCKCLVLDADDTLWGGVIGEDGIGGIKLSEDFPGSIYKDFQRYVLALRRRGILLALASKNDEADVLRVLDTHEDCLLKRGDFAAWQINWNDKASNLRALAQELNLGLDALVFFDDNPVERAWVKEQAGEVNVIATPKDPALYIDAIEDSGYFDHLQIVEEDLSRAAMYTAEKERQTLSVGSTSKQEFLQKLRMQAMIGAIGDDVMPRVSQLIAKTNQFNLTTRRHSQQDLERLVKQDHAVGLWLRLKDQFGDSGLVGVALAKPVSAAGRAWEVDTFLLSCRVIGRGVENLLMSKLSAAVQERGGQQIIGTYVPSARNGLAKDFYPSLGFKKEKDAFQGAEQWSFDLSQAQLEQPDYIEVHAK